MMHRLQHAVTASVTDRVVEVHASSAQVTALLATDSHYQAGEQLLMSEQARAVSAVLLQNIATTKSQTHVAQQVHDQLHVATATWNDYAVGALACRTQARWVA